jgi:hypothetical protein
LELTVACVLRSGGIYTPEWVSKLRNMVKRHLHMPHRFVCISDVPVDCERIPLTKDWPSWWAKFAIFDIAGPVLFFDLDTAIVGPLNDIAEHAKTTNFTMLRDFYFPDHHGSGMMAWGGDMRWLYEDFSADAGRLMTVKRKRIGDQGLIEEMVPARPGGAIRCWQDAVPGQVVSYKAHCRNGVPSGTRVVCLHGDPKFMAMPETDLVRKAWERA